MDNLTNSLADIGFYQRIHTGDSFKFLPLLKFNDYNRRIIGSIISGDNKINTLGNSVSWVI